VAALSCLQGTDGEQPLIFNRIAIACASTPKKSGLLLTQGDISQRRDRHRRNGSIDLFGRAALTARFAGTPMSASALKRIWPIRSFRRFANG